MTSESLVSAPGPGRARVVGVGGGVALGAVMLAALGTSPTWALLLAATSGLPIYFLALGSLTRGLQALLVLSLSMTLDVFIGYSETYAVVRPGVPVTFTGLLLVLLFAVRMAVPRDRRVPMHMAPRVTVPFALLVVWAGLSAFVAVEPGYVLQALPGYITAFLIYLYAVQLMQRTDDVLFLSMCLAIVVTLMGALGVVQYATGGWPSLELLGGRESEVVQSYGRDQLSRVSGLLRHPNTFSTFLNGVLPVLLVLAFFWRNRVGRVLAVSAFTLGTLALVLTYSRGGWLAWAISIALVLILVPKHTWRPGYGTALVGIGAALATVTVFATTPLYERIETRLAQDDQGAAGSRMALARAGLEIAAEHPIAGVGLGNYKFESPMVVDDRGVWLLEPGDGMPMRVHNLFLLAAAELGIPGLLLLVTVIVLFFVRTLRAIRRGTPFQSLLAIGFGCGLVASLSHCMLEPATLADPGYIILAFCGGCVTGLGGAPRDADAEAHG